MSDYDPQSFAALTFHDAARRFADGADSPRAYLERCLETIAEREPEVLGWVTRNEAGARQAADESDRRWKAGRPLSSIDGMPIGIKDLYMTRDMPTKMGSPLYKGNFPKQDSACVQAVRQAGGIVLGKTVTTEMGFSHPGPTNNPFARTHTPGGSSSGSAAVVGARMVPAAIGSQVLGSVIRPASFCANHAIKPTMGALHRGERQGLSHSHLGVHAGSFVDMWNVAYEIAMRSGGDPGYPALSGPAALGAAQAPQRLILIESEGWAVTDEETHAAFRTVLDTLAEAGVEIVTRRNDPLVEAFERAIGDSLDLVRDICGYEMRWSLQNLVDQHGGGLSDSLASRLELSRALTNEDYRVMLLRREEARRALLSLAGSADAMISLSSVGPAPLKDNEGLASGIVHTTGDPAYNAWTSHLGAPSITVPLLAVRGLPVGVQLAWQHHSDHRLTGIALWLEGIYRAARR